MTESLAVCNLYFAQRRIMLNDCLSNMHTVDSSAHNSSGISGAFTAWEDACTGGLQGIISQYADWAGGARFKAGQDCVCTCEAVDTVVERA